MSVFNDNNNEEIDELRPSTARSTSESIGGSRFSLRSLFTSKRIGPIVADVVYGTGDEAERISARNVHKTEKRLSLEVDYEDKNDKGYFVRLFFRLKNAWIEQRHHDRYKEPELFIKETLRHLFTYIVYLLLLIIISFGMSTANMFYFSTAINDNILSQTNQGVGFSSIGSISDFWTYADTPLMETIFWKEWYNSNQDGTPANQTLIYYDDIFVGVPRLRLVRVKPNSCKVPSLFQSQIFGCYDQYSDTDFDTSPFGPGNDTAWIYSLNGSSYSYTGVLATYESGGYMQPLTRDKVTSQAIIQNLKDNLWLNHSARAVFIDFTLYNPNIDLFCIVKLVFEFPLTGGALSNAAIRPVKLVRYVSTFDFFIMFCEVAFVILLIYYVLEEIIEIKRGGFKYFVKLWNLIDVFVIIISFSCVFMNIYRCTLTNSKLESLLTQVDTYIDFDFATYWQKFYNETISINIFLSWIKIFKYISFNKSMCQLTDTLSNSIKDVCGFVVMFIIVFFSYAQFSYLLLSSYLEDYSTFSKAIFALFRIMLADFQFYNIYKANSLLGPLFFISFIFFVFFVLLSMFFAIMDDSYEETRDRLGEMKETIHIAQYIKNKIMNRLKSDKVKKMEEILQSGDIKNVEELSFHAWRTELLKHGYADVEIQALFMKYDQDGDRVLDYDERRQMLDDIKKANMDMLTTNDEVDDDTEDNDENKYVTEEQMRDLKSRINAVETGLSDIVLKIDRVLEFLAESEHAKIEHQKNIRCSLAILQNSRQNLVT